MNAKLASQRKPSSQREKRTMPSRTHVQDGMSIENIITVMHTKSEDDHEV